MSSLPKKLNELIDSGIKSGIKKFVKTNNVMARKAIIVSDFNKEKNTVSIKFPNDESTSTNYYYPNKSGKDLLIGQKAYLVYQVGNVSQGYVDLNEPLNMAGIDINEIKKEIMNSIYSVGDIFLSYSDENPSLKYGGTWELTSQGRVLVGVDSSDSDFNSPQKTGGEKENTLTLSQMPQHTHNVMTNIRHIDGVIVTAEYINADLAYGQARRRYENYQEQRGGNQPHNNMQPYITCYIWEKIA